MMSFRRPKGGRISYTIIYVPEILRFALNDKNFNFFLFHQSFQSSSC